ncbi:SubName: Full=Uncharacterized protein {ECO:0000313/EMBL:CCA69456.1} [Serendipita indica DSM 11827]|nr:SubName: Full=Uncharacterized protein {ECO:0000313/EMBL:CCA69456.1} [Serendipita indica DSM 11827]
MSTAVEQEKIKEIITRDEFKHNLNYGLRFLNATNKTVTSLTFLYVIGTRMLVSAYFGAGAIVTMAIVKVLKRIFREARPVGMTYKVTYGFPSTHSATITYYATFITLSCFYLPIHPAISFLPRVIINPLIPLAAISGAAVVCVSRIRLGHHTLKQVGAGAIVGLIVGWLWFDGWAGRGWGKDIGWQLTEYLPYFIRDLIR